MMARSLVNLIHRGIAVFPGASSTLALIPLFLLYVTTSCYEFIKYQNQSHLTRINWALVADLMMLINIYLVGEFIRKGLAVSGSFYQGLRHFSTVPNDPDTHEDFRPTNKIESSGISLKDIVEQDVKENPVMIYMKGVPDLPRCGFSALAVRVLKEYNVPLSARNTLEDNELKNAVKGLSHWPTFPQIFIKGEFVGGSAIILNMHQTGELKENLKRLRINRARQSKA